LAICLLVNKLFIFIFLSLFRIRDGASQTTQSAHTHTQTHTDTHRHTQRHAGTHTHTNTHTQRERERERERRARASERDWTCGTTGSVNDITHVHTYEEEDTCQMRRRIHVNDITHVHTVTARMQFDAKALLRLTEADHAGAGPPAQKYLHITARCSSLKKKENKHLKQNSICASLALPPCDPGGVVETINLPTNFTPRWTFSISRHSRECLAFLFFVYITLCLLAGL